MLATLATTAPLPLSPGPNLPLVLPGAPPFLIRSQWRNAAVSSAASGTAAAIALAAEAEVQPGLQVCARALRVPGRCRRRVAARARRARGLSPAEAFAFARGPLRCGFRPRRLTQLVSPLTSGFRNLPAQQAAAARLAAAAAAGPFGRGHATSGGARRGEANFAVADMAG